MKIRRILPILLGVVMLGGCAHKNESGKKAIESYSQALSDSIRNVTAEIDSCNDVSTTLTDKINNLLPEFRAVEKSREVEPNTSLRNISIDSHDGIFQGYLVIGVTDQRQLTSLIKKIKTVSGVRDVSRI